jgi:hypothetical protein
LLCDREAETIDHLLVTCLVAKEVRDLFVWLISHQPAVFFSQNKPAISNQPTVLFSQNKLAPATSHQPNEQAVGGVPVHGQNAAVSLLQRPPFMTGESNR